MRRAALLAIVLSLSSAAASAQRPVAQGQVSGVQSARPAPGGPVRATAEPRAIEALPARELARQAERDAERQAAQEQQLIIERDYEAARQGGWFRRGEIIIASADQAADARLRALGLELKSRTNLTGAGLVLSTWLAPPNGGAERLLAAVRAADPGAAADLNYVYEFREAAASRGRAAAITAPEGDGAHKIGAIIDVGLPANGAWSAGVEVRAQRFSEGPPAASDHAGAVAALMAGAAGRKGLTLLTADVAEAGPLRGAAANSIALAADWAARGGAKVINISLTGPENRVLAAVIGRLTARGVTVVAAAGNDGPRAPAPYPAALPEVVAVTAVDEHNRIWRRATQGPHVDFAAPGVDVAAGGKLWTGTSMAAPVVAGMLLRSGESAEALSHRALDLGAPGKDPVFGAGLITAP